MFKRLAPVFAAALLLLCAGFADAGTRVRFAANTSGNNCAGGTSCAIGSLAGGNVAVTGNYIVGCYISEGGVRTVSSVADAASTTYTLVTTTLLAASGSVQCFYGVVAANNAGQSVVATISGNSGDTNQGVLWEISGLDASQASLTSDQQVGNAGAGGDIAVTTHATGAITPANATGFIIACARRTNGTYTDDTNFTEETTGVDNNYCGYIASPPASSRALTYTSDTVEFSAQEIVAFVGASAGASNAPRAMHYKRMMQ